MTRIASSLNAATFQRIAAIAKAEAGLLLPEIKREMVQSRLARRLRALKLATYEAYCDLIEREDAGDEREELVNSLTTNVTRFMREPHHFEEFAADVIPVLASEAKAGKRVRIWSAGCSSGEEPYTIAISCARKAPELFNSDFRILATDIDQRVLATARGGRYPAEAVTAGFGGDVGQHFDQIGVELEVKRHLRSAIAFKRLNLIEPWPMSGPFQAIFCRNVLIYFDAETQKRIISGFAKLLCRGGSLFLGHSERVDADLETLFERSGLTSYRRV